MQLECVETNRCIPQGYCLVPIVPLISLDDVDLHNLLQNHECDQQLTVTMPTERDVPRHNSGVKFKSVVVLETVVCLFG